jgi:hypothetical protein
MGEGIFESYIALARFSPRLIRPLADAGEGKGEGSVLTRRWISKNGIKKAARRQPRVARDALVQ